MEGSGARSLWQSRCHTPSLTFTHIDTHSVLLSLFHTDTHSLTLTHSLTHSLTHTLTHTHTHTLSHAYTLAHSHAYSHLLTHTLSLTHAHKGSQPVAKSMSTRWSCLSCVPRTTNCENTQSQLRGGDLTFDERVAVHCVVFPRGPGVPGSRV